MLWFLVFLLLRLLDAEGVEGSGGHTLSTHTHTMTTLLGHFDESDLDSFYYQHLTYEEARLILAGEDQGVFLVRKSSTAGRPFVVCLKEGAEVSQYPVESMSDGHLYVRQEHPFRDLPSLISFYKRNLFASSALIRPVDRDKVFPPSSPNFRNTMQLDAVTVRPVEQPRPFRGTSAPPVMDGPPVYARVIRERIPIAYDTSALPLHVGDILRVTRRRDGRGHGEVISSGKKGDFPLTHVELIEHFEGERVN